MSKVTFVLHIPEAKVVCAHRPTFTSPAQTITYETFDTPGTRDALDDVVRWMHGGVNCSVPMKCWLWGVIPAHGVPWSEVEEFCKWLRGGVWPRL